MLTRRCFVTTLALLLPGSMASRVSYAQSAPAKPATVTLLIDGMT